MDNTLTESLFTLLSESKVELSESAKKTINDAFFAVTKEKDSSITELRDVLKEAKEEIVSLRGNKAEEVKKIVKEHKEFLTSKINKFLELKLESTFPKSLLEAQAKLETFEPLVEGIKGAFSSKGIELDSKGHKLLKSAKSEIKGLRQRTNEETAKRIKLEEATEKLLGKYALMEKMKGLTDSQQKRITEMFKGESYDVINEKFNTVRDLVVNEHVKEKTDKKGKKKSKKLTVIDGTTKTKINENDDDIAVAFGAEYV